MQHALATVTIITAAASSAHAYVNTVFQSPDPASYGTLVQSLDIASTSWDFPVDAPFTNSGYKAEILSGGTPIAPDFSVNPNTTSLLSEVFRVNTPTTITDASGNLNLVPGDLVFSYTIQLTGNNANTIAGLAEFGVTSLGQLAGGPGIFDATILKGRGLSIDTLANPTANFPIEQPGDLTVNAPIVSSLDWQWDFVAGNRLQNAEEIKLLIFTRPALIREGFGKFVGAPGEPVKGTDFNANGAPVLVPVIPAPASAAILAGAGVLALRRRR